MAHALFILGNSKYVILFHGNNSYVKMPLLCYMFITSRVNFKTTGACKDNCRPTSNV